MSRTAEHLQAVEAPLRFTRAADLSRDDARPQLWRARTLAPDEAGDPAAYDTHVCRLHDCSSDPGFRPDLRVHGFAHADLSSLPRLQRALERVRVAGRLDDTDAAEIRRRLLGRAVKLSGGGRLWLLFIAREGFFMRRAGPNGLRLHGDGLDAAVSVHADQDVDGTPVRQILRGAAPWLFHHDSPEHANRRSRLHLVNVWIPLEQATRPLALMDRRTLDRRAHQLRYGLPTDSFLRRDAHMRVNDIWTFLYHESQQWYFTSEIDANTAYVFDTLSAPHASFVVPGEERAEERRGRLLAAIDAVGRRDERSAAAALALAGSDGPWREPATDRLRRAIAAMEALIVEARESAGSLCRGEDPRGWITRAAEAAERVVRKSIEMRAIALLVPDLRSPRA